MSSGKGGKADIDEGVMKFSYFPADVSKDVAKSLFLLQPVFLGILFILDDSAAQFYPLPTFSANAGSNVS